MKPLRRISRRRFWESASQALSKMTQQKRAQHDFVGEAVRQLAHYANEKTNSETGHLERLDEGKHTERVAFYDRLLRQVGAEEFGPQLGDWIRRVAQGAEFAKSLVPSSP